MSRRTAREECFKLLYQVEIHKGNEDEILYSFFEDHTVNDKDKKYIEDVVRGTIQNMDKINECIEKNVIGWKMNRISKVTMAILRIAVFEMLYREDIPCSVSINEAVELAKNYDNEKSGTFVNGILGAVQKTYEVKDVNEPI